MDQRIKSRLLKLAQADKRSATIHLYCARMDAIGKDTSLEFAQSGKSIQSIIDEYQEWHDEADKAVKLLEAVWEEEKK